jgi:hypothetical protein
MRRQRSNAVTATRESMPTSPAGEVESSKPLQPHVAPTDAVHLSLDSKVTHDATAPASDRSRRYRYSAGTPLLNTTRLPVMREDLIKVDFSRRSDYSLPSMLAGTNIYREATHQRAAYEAAQRLPYMPGGCRNPRRSVVSSDQSDAPVFTPETQVTPTLQLRRGRRLPVTPALYFV